MILESGHCAYCIYYFISLYNNYYYALNMTLFLIKKIYIYIIIKKEK